MHGPRNCRIPGTYPNFFINQLPGHLHLLRGASDGEDAHVGVGVKGWVPLKLHVSSRLLVDVLNGLSTWGDKGISCDDHAKPYWILQRHFSYFIVKGWNSVLPKKNISATTRQTWDCSQWCEMICPLSSGANFKKRILLWVQAFPFFSSSSKGKSCWQGDETLSVQKQSL